MDLEKVVKKFDSYKYLEARYHKNESSSIFLMNGRLLGVSKEKNEGYSVRAYEQGILYFASSTNAESLDLKKIQGQGWEELEDTDVYSGKYEVKQVKPFDSIPIDEKIKYFKDIYERIKSLDIKSKLVNFNIWYSESLEEKRIMFKDGSTVEGLVPRINFSYSLVLKYMDKTATVYSDEFGASGGLELLDSWKIGDKLEEKIKEVDKVLTKGKTPKEGKTDVVLSSLLAGIMAHESVGHPFEADRVLGREGAQAGLSYLKDLNIRKIGSNAVSVIDDPTLPNSNGFFLIDDEGVKARAKYLIKDGEVNELLQDRFSSPKFKTKSNGSARAMSFDREPIIRMSNTFFQPGDMSFEELIEDVKEGVYFKSYMEWNIDDMRLGERYVGLEAYEIKNGEIGDPLLFPVLEGKTTEFLPAIDAADRELKFYAGICGKGDPDQAIPVWLGGPDLRLRNVKVKVM
ncbi:peptidase U62 modulator of DNA gyrase [Acidianus hospitalis W1]|uniref:Peptidase U62 modulator of DNA gyrase n=1 Tax=Acidianus hospitalis (strain W1) TaxID=933801 RepID=F4B772_ACIHW|nr:TldD/PmbA family protein [Acidianus hospitalis]AEE94692.1 peptidase U62 modulator of DNA gyrase [Acidianus hospitalis W1]